MNSPLRILMTTLELRVRRGAQNVTRDLALGLRAAGHDVTLYTRAGGAVADDLRGAGFAVETSLGALRDPFDVIHGQHLVSCSPVLAQYPDTPAVFVAHDNVSWFDAAPILPNIRLYAGVSRAIAERVAHDAEVDAAKVRIVLNGVDMDRFRPGPAPNTPPRRALAFAKNADHVAVVREACARRGIEVDFVGEAASVQLEDPAKALPLYDLVFASALAALEAMACLRPVIVCDGRGMAGMVDEARYAAWRPENFGLGVLNAPLSAERALAELDRFDPAEAARVGERFRAEGGVAQWVEQYVALYREAMATPAPSPEARARQWGRHLERWTPRPHEQWGWTHERQAYTNEFRRLRAGLDTLPYDHRLTFGKDGAAARFVEPVGFEPQSDGSVWTTARFASMRFRPGPTPSGVEVLLEYAVHLPDPAFALETAVLANGVEIDRWSERGESGWVERSRRLMLPGELCHPLTTWLAFRFAQTAGPAPSVAPAFSLRAATFRVAGA